MKSITKLALVFLLLALPAGAWAGDKAAPCTGEGEFTLDPTACCTGLQAVTGCVPGEPCGPGYFCAACGDGVCGDHETPWECPADCRDCSTFGVDDRTCAKLTVRYWAERERMRTAEALAALPYDKRADEINRHGWFGQVPGAVIRDFHEDGMLARLSGTVLSQEDLGLAVDEDEDADVVSDAFLSDFGEMLFGLTAGSELVKEERFAALTGETTVAYRQRFGGVPVVGGALSVTVDRHGRITRLNNRTLPSISHGTVPQVSLDDAVAAIGQSLGKNVVEVRHGLYIYPDPEDRHSSMLAYEIEVVESVVNGGEPFRGIFRVDALDAEGVPEVHPWEWHFPPGDLLPAEDTPKEVEFYNVDKPYSEAYCLTWDSGDCVEYYSSCAGTYPGPGIDWAHDLMWADGEWASNSFDDYWYYLYPPLLYLVWNVLPADFPGNPNDVFGKESDPFRIGLKSRMLGESVGYCDPYTENLFLVEGADAIGTLAHEFGHRLHSLGVLVEPSETLQEAIGDTLAMVYNQKMRTDENAPTEICFDVDGDPMKGDPGVGHGCFNTIAQQTPYGTTFRHQNIQVHPVGVYTRCSAVEELELGASHADDPENIWRSFRDPEVLNHGHGRGPRTFDQHLSTVDATTLARKLIAQADNDNEAYINEEFCGGDSSAETCTCGSVYSASHTNVGIHNRFFYNISGFGDADYPIVKDDEGASAEKQLDLLKAIYTETLTDYTQWADKVADILDNDSVDLTGNQTMNVRKSLRATQIFQSAGVFDDMAASDMEAVVHWSGVSGQRLYVFYREPDGTEHQHPRLLKYKRYDIDSEAIQWQADCEMPAVNIGGIDEPARSGFAPAVADVGSSFWVGWSQYEAPPDTGGPGNPYGRLAYATFYPAKTHNVCGDWSAVVYDDSTRVYGSPRATVVDRGSTYIIDIPDPGKVYKKPDVIERPVWFGYVDPVDTITLNMLGALGYAPDVPMEDVWSRHPNYGMSTARSTGDEDEDGDGYTPHEEENLGHMHAAIREMMSLHDLGVSSRPQFDDPHAPKGAEREVSLRVRRLNQALQRSLLTNPPIVDSARKLLPNAVGFITNPPPRMPPVALDMSLVTGLADLRGHFFLNIEVKTVAVSFLDEPVDGLSDVVVRQYGVTEDPFTPVDIVIGRAHFAPALATLGKTVYENLSNPGGTETVWRDNVLACTDFEFTGHPSARPDAMSCKVFRNGRIDAPGEFHWIAPSVPGVGPDVSLAASPRAVNIGDVAYVFYRPYAGICFMRYVAFAGADFLPLTYNTILSGLEFPDTWDGPSKWVSAVMSEIRFTNQPTENGERWPLFPGAAFVLPYGGLGYVGYYTSDQIAFYARGMEWLY
jgi:hypothetical protein